MKWIAGLGNPGAAYQGTRHNVGFMVVDALAERFGIRVTQSKCKALIGEGNVRGTKVVLIKPMTYMNLSGEAIRSFLDYFKADLADGLIIYDDLDTEIGKIRLRYKGGPGGHNGIKSIIQHTGTQTFNRIRMGISRPSHPGVNIADYVLSNFSKDERDKLAAMVERACDAAEYALDAPFEETMAKFNR
ncbi:aminoacyl-tRNA hydrolase [Paenibacillus cisolokensis]|jgi:peptidyl-tRNA hydrolase|uniref:Peptidyl-tRNA hydrolase n=1 Tax=Paenibacillus cisolokensis TaxID=1658519 RepID=A0ABQ4NA73_9BACL|nr:MULTISPECIES: aminoacyl-tRNA hydrolase [Paenibacillus]ALS25751.1 peptidyl-tRNA hydrolase [Paenibacillus sp. 32O-W]GIQ65145.1 peptidyl-tRNA hydrolase [Paenibacillus cisolokensis]